MATTIPHRELRNNSAAILRAVRDGEIFEVTNDGVVVAVLSPPPAAPLAGMRYRPALIRGGFSALPKVASAESTESTRSVLDDLRGDR